MKDPRTEEAYKFLIIGALRQILITRREAVGKESISQAEVVSAVYAMAFVLAETRPEDGAIIDSAASALLEDVDKLKKENDEK